MSTPVIKWVLARRVCWLNVVLLQGVQVMEADVQASLNGIRQRTATVIGAPKVRAAPLHRHMHMQLHLVLLHIVLLHVLPMHVVPFLVPIDHPKVCGIREKPNEQGNRNVACRQKVGLCT